MISLDRLARRLNVDLVHEQAQLLHGSAIHDAMERAPWQRGLVSIDPARPALIVGVTASSGAAVIRHLVDGYGTGADCHLVDLGIESEPTTVAALGQIHEFLSFDPDDEREIAVWVAASDPYRAARSAETLSRIIARLRAPDGCPWDRQQTSRSLRDDIAGEAYEVMDAIDSGDDRNLAEELGDVLMAVALQAQIAEDEGRFTLADVYETVNTKLVRRHPHVFGDVQVDGTGDIVANWNQIKAQEKIEAGRPAIDPDDPLGRYPVSMPATAVIERLLSDRVLVFGGSGIRHLDPERSSEPDRQVVDQFVGWYASRRAAGYDAEAELRGALLTYLPRDEQPRLHAD